MKPLTLAGSVLTAFGIVALLFASGVRYTSKERLPKDGPAQVITRQEKVISVPPVLAGLAVAAGIGLMIFGSRK